MEKFKHLFTRQKHTVQFKKPFRYFPERVWTTLLISAAVLIVVVIILSWFFFRALSNDSVFEGDALASKSELIHRSKLEIVLSHYREKAAMFKKLSVEKPQIADPSL